MEKEKFIEIMKTLDESMDSINRANAIFEKRLMLGSILTKNNRGHN